LERIEKSRPLKRLDLNRCRLEFADA